MLPVRSGSVCVLLFVASVWASGAVLARADEPGKKQEEKWLLDRALIVSPAAAPVPALKYRLFPLESELKEGNAVPIYLRLIFEQNDAWKRMLVDKPARWNALPLDKLPMGDVQQFLKGLRLFTRQIELGAQRKHADWNYTLDQGDVISILLPDAQTMRNYAPVLVLKARMEMAQGHFNEAAHTCETGLVFSRHVAGSPFLISQLVGIALAREFLHTLGDFIETPNSPNLYWSLSVLPRPLISVRKGLDFEQRTLLMEFPELNHLDLERTPQQWAAVLKKMRTAVTALNATSEGKPDTSLQGPKPDEQAEQSADLESARRYLHEHLGIPAARVDAMAPAHVLLLWLVNEYRDYSDEIYKGGYLPYSEGQKVAIDALTKLKQAPQTEATRLALMFLPAVSKVNMSQNRVMREVAALRVVEAIRIYAAAHDGQLPEKLSDVNEVPVPRDPGTDQPFVYHKDGQTATLSSRLPDVALNLGGIRYRLTIRK